MKKKPAVSPLIKKIITIAAVVALCSAIVGASVFFISRKKEYKSSSKNAIAMGTIVTSKAYGDNAAVINENVISIVQGLEKLISRNVINSAVSRVNKGQTVKLDELGDEIQTVRSISEDTNGAFDLTIGKVSALWDFDSGKEVIPDKKDIEAALKSVDYSKISAAGGRISVAKGQELDLGAVGKGRACDLVKSYLESKEAPGAVVSVGGSILAYGSRNKAGDKWRVAIRHPRKENAFLGTVLLDEGFVSTSGDYEKFFEKGGKRYHHILDARTGYPAESDLISVTIVADSGIISDALSTACFILGSEDGRTLAEKNGVGAIFVDKEMNITTVGDIEFEAAG